MAKDNRLLGRFHSMYSLNMNTPKTSCSTGSVLEHGHIELQVDFRDVIRAAVAKFECPISVDVCRVPGLSVSKNLKSEKQVQMGKARTPKTSTYRLDVSDSRTMGKKHREPPDLEDTALTLTAVHNSKNRLVELSIFRYRCQQIPRSMMQVLGIILPSYTKLTKFTINDCFIDKYTIPELKNILSATNITEVCLDASFLPEANYDILLQEATSLKNLSLQRCYINDQVCNQIVSKLHFQQPAECKLVILNLSSNRISDEGAKSIGEVLRDNRHLRYLNLADNHITDEGVRYIFNVLKEFPLTSDEIIDERRQFMKYLKNFFTANEKCAIDFENDSVKNKSARKQKISLSLGSPMKSVRSKASSRTERFSYSMDENATNVNNYLTVLGPFEHPFQKSQLVIKDGDVYCKGNLVLCYLNLAYNNLTFSSVQRLLDVLEYQRVHRSENLNGLIKVVVDGNKLPVKCAELDNINVIFKEVTRKFVRSKTVIGES